MQGFTPFLLKWKVSSSWFILINSKSFFTAPKLNKMTLKKAQSLKRILRDLIKLVNCSCSSSTASLLRCSMSPSHWIYIERLPSQFRDPAQCFVICWCLFGQSTPWWVILIVFVKLFMTSDGKLSDMFA